MRSEATAAEGVCGDKTGKTCFFFARTALTRSSEDLLNVSPSSYDTSFEATQESRQVLRSRVRKKKKTETQPDQAWLNRRNSLTS
jgi:hypothetical protein